MPDAFDFRVDTEVIKTYWKPVGCYFDKLPKLYYDSYEELAIDYIIYVSENPPLKPLTLLYPESSFFTSIDVALQTLDEEFLEINCSSNPEISILYPAGFVFFSVPNYNYGKWVDSHPSFLRYNYNSYDNKNLNYYKNPTWLLNFNFCGVDGKYEENKKFKLGGCNKWEVKWKLRVKPVLFMGSSMIDPPTSCIPIVPFTEITPGDNIFDSYDYSDYSQLVDLINVTETKEGSRWLGLTPMRLETGIYNYDTLQYTPIVDSQSGYPQIITNKLHTKWEGNEKDKIQCVTATEIINTKLGPNSNIDVNFTDSVTPTENDIFYYDFGGTGSLSNSGNFTTQSDNLNSPGTFKINKQSLKIKGVQIDGIVDDGSYIEKLFSYIGGYVSPPTLPAGLTLNLEYNIGGVWNRVLTQSFNSTFINLVEDDNQLLIGTNPKTSIEYVDLDYVDIPSIFGDVDFPRPTNYDYRYNLLITFNRSYKKIDTFSSYTPQIQNYTKLSEEFTFELNGFTNVNLDKGSVGIYLKVLPDADNSQNINLYDKSTVVQVGVQYPESSTILCNNIPMVNGCYPWGELGVSSKSGWQKIENVEYFPLLPLNRNALMDDLISSPLSDDYIAKQNYRYNLDINPNAPALYLMIEEGWVSVEPTCENC